MKRRMMSMMRSSTEISDRVAPCHADEAEEEDDRDLGRREAAHDVARRVDAGDGEPAEVDEDDRADEDPEDDEELALLDEVGLAGLVDQLGDLTHRLVDRHLPDLGVRDEPEEEPERADREAEEEELVPVQAS
jgi:hypothetical protein